MAPSFVSLPRSVRRGVPAALAVLAVAACSGIFDDGSAEPAPPEITQLPRALSAGEEAVIRGGNLFGLALLREIVEADPEESHFISPLSASMALGMALNGADGETFSEMRSALGFGELGREEVNRSYRELIQLLGGLDSSVDFTLANAVWHHRDWTLRPTFREVVESAFGAEVTAADFRAPDTPRRIDDWVRHATRDRIDGIAPHPIPEDAVAYLLNAIHFKGDWTEQFDPARTRDAPFHLEDGTTRPIRLMMREGKVGVGYWQGHQVADLPYGGKAWSMTLVLPAPGTRLRDLVASLDAAGWHALLDTLQPREGIQVGLPRFGLKWEGALNEPLIRLGMESAFNPSRADFSRLFQEEERLYITAVRQKTFLRVDEEGTEAAAVTSVEVGVTSLPPSFIADRPFLLAIRERHSGTLLFLGAIAEPPLDP